MNNKQVEDFINKRLEVLTKHPAIEPDTVKLNTVDLEDCGTSEIVIELTYYKGQVDTDIFNKLEAVLEDALKQSEHVVFSIKPETIKNILNKEITVEQAYIVNISEEFGVKLKSSMLIENYTHNGINLNTNITELVSMKFKKDSIDIEKVNRLVTELVNSYISKNFIDKETK